MILYLQYIKLCTRRKIQSDIVSSSPLKWAHSPVNQRTVDDPAMSTSLQQAFNVLIMIECHHWEMHLVCIDVYVGNLKRHENAI